MNCPPKVGTAARFLLIIGIAVIQLMIAARHTFAQDLPARSLQVLLKDFVDNCRLIEPGTEDFPQQFQMGRHFLSPFAMPEHPVSMTHSFRISRFEMTQDLYTAIMGRNPSRWTGPRNSAESMSFQEAQVFCAKLTVQLQTAKLIEASDIVRLPTEEEWEYCCRAGTSTHYSFGDSAGSTASDDADSTAVLNNFAWHTGNAAGNDPAVGVLKPNPWGLFDMHGYLWEYVSDEYTSESTAVHSAAATKPSAGATVRIMRGGSWRDHASQLTSGARQPIPDHVASDAIGFRCLIAIKPAP